MANAVAYSPKEWQVFVAKETTAGASKLSTSGMYALDVDSIGSPSLNVNQVLDVRTGVGRTFKGADFFQDNIMRVSEISISGTLHDDVGHLMLLENICGDTTGSEIVVTSSYTPPSVAYDSANTTSGDTLTVALRAPDHSNAQSLVFEGCVVTNFSYSADTGTEGGRYKFSATLQTGEKPTLNETSTLAGNNDYANTTDILLSGATATKINNIDVVMSSFNVTVDNPAVFSGVSSTGYETVNRGAEIAITAESSVKYDGLTKGLINTFDTQAAEKTSNLFVITYANKYGVAIPSGVFTNVSINEGDVLALDCAIKASFTSSVTFNV